MKRVRDLALVLVFSLAALALGFLAFQPPSASANTYIGSQDANDPNSNTLLFDYVWGVNNETVTVGLVGTLNLEAVWTNTVTGQTLSAIVTNSPTATSNSSIIPITTPPNSWSAGTKIQLEVKPRDGATVSGLIGLDNNSYAQTRLWEVRSFGNFSPFTQLKAAFQSSTTSLRISAQLPATVKDLQTAFASSGFNSTISNWVTTNVTMMTSMFTQAKNFNQPIGSWDVSNVTNMEAMFNGASAFNQPIGSWDVSSVVNFRRMFFTATKFNQPVGSWDVSSALSMDFMFDTATSFNQPIGSWDVSKVTNMRGMLSGVPNFNQNLSGWDVRRVTDMTGLFESASSFNNGEQTASASVSGTAPLSWQTPSLSSAARMFANASKFNQDVSSIDVSRVTDLSQVFKGATFFNNGDAAGSHNGNADVRFQWSTSAVTNLSNAFYGASSFNQDLNSWSVSNVTNMTYLFYSASLFNNGDPEGSTTDVTMTWNPIKVTDMTYTFALAPRFNQDLNSWDTSNLSTLYGAFQSATAFNNGDTTASNTLNADVRMTWSVSNLTSLGSAFFNASSFNQDLNSWVMPKLTSTLAGFRNAVRFNNGDPAGAHETDGVNQVAMTWSLSGVTNTAITFMDATVFNQNVSSWRVSSVSDMSNMFYSSYGNMVFNNGAPTSSQNVLAWTTSSVTNLSGIFKGLKFFNADISGWNTSKVTNFNTAFMDAARFNQPIGSWSTSAATDMSYMFSSATSFDQPLASWNVSKVTSMNRMFAGATAFNEDLSSWGPFNVGNDMTAMFQNATSMNDSPSKWNMTWLPNSSNKLQYFFGDLLESTSSDMALTVQKSILRGWSFQKVNPQSSVGRFKGRIYSNCEEWSSYRRLQLRPWSFDGSTGFAPTAPTCNAVTVTWSPSLSFPVSYGRLKPNLSAVTNGPSGVKYAIYSAGTTGCRVDENTGRITHTSSGSCEVIAYDAAVTSNTAVQPGYRIAVFSLPTPVYPPTPTEPTITGTSPVSGAIGLSFSAPITSGTAPLTGYEVGYSLTQGGQKTWVSVSPVVTTSEELSYTLSGLVDGNNYWITVRGLNSNGVGSSSPEVGPISPVPPITTPTQPIVYQVTKAGASTIATIEFLAPSSDGGAAISGYEIRFSTNEGVDWNAWQSVSATLNQATQRMDVSLSGLQGSALLPTYYTFEVRARNIAGVSAASLQVPSGAPIDSVVFGNQQAVASFRAAKYDGNSAILGYEYQVRRGDPANPSSISSWISISSQIAAIATTTSPASFTISGLVNGSTHSIWIRAVNAIGGLTGEYQSWSGNTGVPNKAIATLSFDYGITAISYSPNASFSPNVTAVSDGAFSFTTSTPLVCSVNSTTGRIDGLNAGTCLVTLSQAEGSQHQPATASTQIRIDASNQPTLTVSASRTISAFATSITISANGGAGNGTITYTTAPSSTCVITGNTVTLGNAGSFCAVIANKAGDGNYLSASSTQLSLTSTKVLPSLNFAYGVSALSYSSTASYSSSVSSPSNGALSYTTSTPAVCSVDSATGKISNLNAGNCVVTLSQAESTNYLSASSSAQIRIDPTNQPTLVIVASATSSPFGTTVTLSTTGGAGSGAVSFSAVAPSTCVVSGNVVTLGNAGSLCEVIASKASESNYLAASSYQLAIATTKAIAPLSFSYAIPALSYSPSASYSPTVTTVSDGALSFTTSTPLVCSVNSSTGKISGLNAGNCVVILNQAEGSNHQTVSASAQIRIDPANQPTLTISASATTSPYRGTVTLTSSGGAGTGAVTFTPVVSSTCVVAGNVVTLGNAGSFCAVIANKAGDGNYLAASSTQISISTTKIAQAAVSFSNLAEMAAHSSLTVFATGGSGEGVMRYSVTNQGTTGCVLTGTTLTANASGQCTIEASRATSTNYLVSDSVSQVIQVVKASQTLRFTTNVPSEPLAGTSYSPAATASSGLSVSFSVSGSGCSINAGVVSFTAAGDCVVSAGQAGDAAYLTAVTVSQTIAVDRRNQTLTFGASTQAITSKRFGDAAFLLQASSTEQSATVSFTLSPLTTNNACSVFASGLVIVQRVGDCVIEAYSPQTQAVAAASTISKVIAVLPDNASAPFITSVAMGNLSITAGFTPPSYIGGSSVSAYSIIAIDQTPNSTVEVSDSSCGTTLVNGQVSCRITGLENGKTYKIKVAAINGAGIGEYSALSPSITVATNPAAVQNLRVIQGSTTLAISWDDPDSLGGGTFSAYRVFVKRSASSSYNANHYFNVPSQATRNITISAETPPDGMTHPGGPALVNGVAYDIKVVTVTTANTEELTGNTAVVNQIPRTTPEPPRLANALVVGNKLVLTWTAPISDGGAAITTYSAVVGNSPCLFANPTDTFCEIALPTAPGNYVFAIAAQNVAGSSTEIQGVFTVASYNSNTPTTTGGSVVTEPAKPSESAPIISSVSFSVNGKQIFIRGSFLKGISKVLLGSVEARIVSQTSEMIILTAPQLAPGSYSVLLHLTDKTVLRYEKELLVKGAKPETSVKKTSKITGFKPGSSELSPAMKNSLIKIFKANKGSKSLQCVGHTQGPTILKSDARLAMKRAVAVCNFAKKLGFKVVSSSYQNNKKVGAQFRRVDLIFTK